ncbi:hypothetical protein LTR36_007668 [Oleoguttula mirabilis]|uniref:Uncharacterized protein n=1 Tax=Oleoguttula mirabilis TaxID=1507867 RepID=A0AAV9JV86_9PEZI|nr:hypothetical protein LTR36_007668 [Oleoguttula mirabilis]
MILSPYRNPPYRTPTPKNSTSPPPGPSPKRKRTGTQRSAPVPHIDTRDFAPESGADSPRSNVAESFHDLSIQQPQSPHLPVVSTTNDPAETPRKRLKRDQSLRRRTNGYELDADVFSTPEFSGQSVVYSRNASPIEIDETPDCRSRVTSAPPLSHDRSQSPRQSFDLYAIDGSENVRSSRMQSLPPPTPLALPLQSRDEAGHSASSPMHSTEDPGLDRVALTWQDDEITGHDIDPTSPDDDGLGINGIGFKPTAAMAYARSQKRKQQVNEWRVREARESRQKRFERRRGADGTEPKSDPAARRSVRFEGFG